MASKIARAHRWVIPRLRATTLALLTVAGVSASAAEARSITVAAPSGAPAELVSALARSFEAQSGTQVLTMPLSSPDHDLTFSGGSKPDALVLPERISSEAMTASTEQETAFESDVVLVGSRADRARVRGQNDIRTALRWIANVRALYVASSPQLGVRNLELRLFHELGVNVQARPSWYEDVPNSDEAQVVQRAAASGSYALVERASFAASQRRGGLEVVASGDPLLRTRWRSLVLRSDVPEARAWHGWLLSEAGQQAIAQVQLNGTAPFTRRKASDAPVGLSDRPADPS